MTLAPLVLSIMFALSPNDLIELSLANGDTVTGRLSSAQPGVLFINSAQGTIEVGLELIGSASINGVAVNQSTLELEVEELWQATTRRLTPSGSLPNAYWAATASALLPGSGQRLLGQQRAADSYLLADLALLSLGGWLILDRQDYGNAIPLLGLDMVFRIYSAAEAYKDTRMREAIFSGETHVGN